MNATISAGGGHTCTYFKRKFPDKGVPPAGDMVQLISGLQYLHRHGQIASLLISAGARLTVILLTENSKPAFFLLAERTLSRASFTYTSGSPIRSNAVKPVVTSISNLTFKD